MDSKGKCHLLATNDMDDAAVEYIDKKYPEKGISLTYLSDEPCTSKDYYTLTIDV